MPETTKILKSSSPVPESSIVNNTGLVLKPSIGTAVAPMSRYARLLMGQERAITESVVGYDDRTRITSTDEYPWCMICYLELKFPDGATGIGTGWLIGKNKVMTAGHCVFNQLHGGWADSIKVIPGNSVENPELGRSDFAPYGEFEAVVMQTTEEWVSDTNITFDVGVIHIDKPIADELGNFGIQISNDGSDLVTKYVRVAGYPLRQHPRNEDDTMSTRTVGGQMWTNSDVVVDVQDGRIKYQLDTTGGQSGAPVVLLDDTSQGPVAVGIHNYGFNPNDAYQENKATLINAAIWTYIEGWLQENY